MNLRMGRISKLFSPGYSWCQRCNTTWNFVEPHAVQYEQHRGHFALCEKCWNECDTGDRVQYHFDALGRFGNFNQEKWTKIQKAIEEGTP